MKGDRDQPALFDVGSRQFSSSEKETEWLLERFDAEDWRTLLEYVGEAAETDRFKPLYEALAHVDEQVQDRTFRFTFDTPFRFSRPELDEHFLYKLSTRASAALYHSAPPDGRSKVLEFILNDEPLRQLMLDAWNQRDIDELAVIYASVYDDTSYESRCLALDGMPIDALRELLLYDWGTRTPRGIVDWLREEIEDKES